MSLPSAAPSIATDAAQARLKTLLTQNKTRARELVELVQSTIIDDYTREPKDVGFWTHNPAYEEEPKIPSAITLSFTRSKHEYYRIHPHALGQISTRLQIDNGYVRKLNVESPGNWRRLLLRHNLNELLHNTEFSKRGEGPMRFLLRFVGDELRGFMSRSYGRHLASKPMLAAFLSACNQAGAEPTDAVATAVKSTLSCYLPIVFEPTPKEFVAVGVRWANSDFAAGRLTVSLCMMSIARGTAVVLSDDYARRHIGSIIQDDDLLEISDATAAKEVEAAASAIKDSVDNLLKPDSVQRLMTAIESAQAQQIDWATLRRDLKKFLYEQELAALDQAAEKGIRDLPPPGTGADGKPLATKWWTMNVLALLADGEQDNERRIELQQEAGRFIELKK